MPNPLTALALCFALLMPSLAFGQGVRQPVQIDSSSKVWGPAIATEGELSAVVYKEDSSENILVSVSDGAGIAWSAPVRIDDDTTNARKYIYDYSIVIASGNIYVAWKDDRGGANSDCYFSVSSDGGATFSPNTRIDDGSAAGMAPMDEARIVADDLNVYIGMRVIDMMMGMDSIQMASSNDGGVTWNPTLRADTMMMGDCDDFGIACDGINVYIAFARAGMMMPDLDDLFYIMSHTGGLSWMMMEMQADPSGPGVGDIVDNAEIKLETVGDMGMSAGIALAWLEEDLAGGTNDELHVMFSMMGGHMWMPETVLVSGPDVDNHDLAFDGMGAVVTWEDDSTGADEVYVYSTPDMGMTSYQSQLSSGGGAYPVCDGSTMGFLAVAWADGGYPETTVAVSSRNGGATWLPAADLDQTLATGDSDYVEIAYNSTYNNFQVAWLDDALGSNNCYVGGLRVPSVTPVSPTFTPGDDIHFAVNNFGAMESMASKFVVLISTDVGSYSLPFGDGRSTGLKDNRYLPSMLSVLSGNLDMMGNGTTPVGALTIPSSLPPGRVFQSMALSFSTTGGVSFGSLTDLAPFTIM